MRKYQTGNQPIIIIIIKDIVVIFHVWQYIYQCIPWSICPWTDIFCWARVTGQSLCASNKDFSWATSALSNVISPCKKELISKVLLLWCYTWNIIHFILLIVDFMILGVITSQVFLLCLLKHFAERGKLDSHEKNVCNKGENNTSI